MAWMQISFHSESLRRDVPIEVLLPCSAEGAAPGEHGYKTLYLLHGYTGNQTSYLLDAPVKRLLEEFGIAIVIPAGENHVYLDREVDGARWQSYVADELVAFTRKLFPSLSHRREDTIIGGFSMGGFGSLHVGLRYSETFGHVIVNSPPLCDYFQKGYAEALESGVNSFGLTKGFYELIVGPVDKIFEGERNPILQAKKLLASGKEHPDFYFSVGCNDELCPAMRDFIREFKTLGFSMTYQEFYGTHEVKVFNAGLEAALINLYGKPQEQKSVFWIDGEPMAI